MIRRKLPVVQESTVLAADPFPYDVVAQEYQEFVRERAHRARLSLRKSIEAFIETGRHLREARPHIPHGYWGKFVERAVEMSASWATNCMALHERFVELRPDVLQRELRVSVTAMIHLAKAPDAAIDEVIDLCANGAELIIDQVDDVISRHRGDDSKARRKKARDDVGTDEPLLAGDALVAFSIHAVHGGLIPDVISEMHEVLTVLEDADELLTSGQRASKKMVEEGVRERARWLTDALEQITQMRAKTDIKLVHDTFLERIDYPPGPWADVALFLADVSTSQGWERIKSDDIPKLVSRGLKALRETLLG